MVRLSSDQCQRIIYEQLSSSISLPALDARHPQEGPIDRDVDSAADLDRQLSRGTSRSHLHNARSGGQIHRIPLWSEFRWHLLDRLVPSSARAVRLTGCRQICYRRRSSVGCCCDTISINGMPGSRRARAYSRQGDWKMPTLFEDPK